MYMKLIYACCVLLWSANALCDQRAFIFVRHGDDLEPDSEYIRDCHDYSGIGNNWGECNANNRWLYEFNDEKQPEAEVAVMRLSESGWQQAEKLARLLPEWLADNGYYQIGRVVAKTPLGYDTTQNPFHTVVPLVKTLELDMPMMANSNNRYSVRFKFLTAQDPKTVNTYPKKNLPMKN